MIDVLGTAIYDYYHHNRKHKLWIYNKYGKKEEMPLSTYFRTENDMPDLEWLAIEKCYGKVLDIGAGAGCHSLLLQQQGKNVTAIEISSLASSVIQKRGVKQVVNSNIFDHNGTKYDTLLLLMNGIGLTGTIDNLKLFLNHAKTLLNQGGQLLFDSSDVAYIYEHGVPTEYYYGEIWYQYQYKKQETDWFRWLYIDEHMLQQVATAQGWNVDILYEDEFGQYLAKLTC